jgi:hypothetical protein
MVVTASADEKKPTPKPAEKTTNHIDGAVARIRSHVGWFGENPQSFAVEFLHTAATLNYVQSRVSPLEYSLRVQRKQPLPGRPEEYLSTGSGICGGQVATCREILTRLGLRNRPVEFYLHGATAAENHSHIGFEVYYSDSWHFFDVTWGTYFCSKDGRPDQVLSIEDVLKTEGILSLAVTNRSDLWFQQWIKAGYDPFDYVTVEKKDVIVGRGGTVHLRTVDGPTPGQFFKPIHQPNYFGRNNDSVDSGSIVIQLADVNKDARVCTITISGLAGSGHLVVSAKDGSVRIPFNELKSGDREIDISALTIDGVLDFSVEPVVPRGIGYVVIKEIVVHSTE